MEASSTLKKIKELNLAKKKKEKILEKQNIVFPLSWSNLMLREIIFLHL